MKKLTNKEITSHLVSHQTQLIKQNEMISIFISYISMKGDTNKLKKYIEKQVNLANKKKNK